MRVFSTLAAMALAFAIAGPAIATEYGNVTKRPIPRYVSLKTDEGNARRGPSLTHRIDWVYTRRDMPLMITGEYGHWRRVEDKDGAGGWMHYSLLSGVRTVLVERSGLNLLLRPDPGAPVSAKLDRGLVARLDECLRDWCRIEVQGYRGWVPKTGLWGVDAAEIRD